MLGRDCVEDGAHGFGIGCLLDAGRSRCRPGSVSEEARPCLAREPDHLAPNRHVLAVSPFEDLGRAQIALERVAHLRLEQRATEPPLAFGSRQDDLAEMDFELIQGSLRGGGGHAKARQDEPDVGVGRLRFHSCVHGLVGQVADA